MDRQLFPTAVRERTVMSTAARYLPHYTLDDYARWPGDWELWQGIPVAMTPSPFGGHQAIARRLTVELARAIEAAHCRAEVLYEIDWIISNDTVVRPDLLVVCGDVPERHVEQTPAIVAEILSPATRERDLKYKLDLYMEQGVGSYLIADPSEETLRLVRRGERGEIQEHTVENAIELTICDDCRIALSKAVLFR